MFEEKYSKPGFDYIVTQAVKKIYNLFLSYPEFLFLLKIILGFVILMAVFFLFKSILA